MHRNEQRVSRAGARRAVPSLGPSRRRTFARPAGLGLLACSLALAACAVDPVLDRPPTPARYSESFSGATRSSSEPRHDLEIVRAARGTGARLREAYLLIESGRPQTAVKVLNRVIFATPKPRRDVEAAARYLRGEAYAAQRDPNRADAEWRAAARLAIEPALTAALRKRGYGPDGRLDRPVEASLGTVEILPRSSWGAKPPRAMERLGNVARITIHHSAVLARRATRSTTAATLRSIQNHHMDTNGWNDVGYHYFVDPEGRVWEGRENLWMGAHTGGQNRGNLGICLLGRFTSDATGQSPTPAQLGSLEVLTARLAREYGLGVDAIVTHQELADTRCPGALLQRQVDAMRDRLGRSALAAGPRPPS